MSEGESKKRGAERIKENIDLFKVCQCCESVILYDHIFCPICDGYRFDYNIENVKKAVEVLLNKKNSKIISLDDLS